MTPQRKVLLGRLLILPAAALGVIAFVALRRSDTPPATLEAAETATAVRVVPVQVLDVLPRALGHGTARAARTWRAMAEVAGTVVEVHPALRPGTFVAKGDLLVRIDATDHDLEVGRAEAQIASIDAQLAQLEQEAENTAASLEIENRSLEIARRELARVEGDVASGAATESERDQSARGLLDLERRVRDLESSLALVPSRRKVLRSGRATEETRLARAHRDVERCSVRAPFGCRLAQVEVEIAQAVAPGQSLLAADGVEAAEVPAQIALRHLRRLARPGTEARVEELLAHSTFHEVFRIDAVVRSRAIDAPLSWKARLVRAETPDPRTRTLPMVVAVDDPYRKARPGERPPLMPGMFVEVELRGEPIAGCFVIPRVALLSGARVRVAGPDSRLEIRDVVVRFTQGDIAVIVEGLADGDLVVVSDPIPAVAGMLLDPHEDEDLAATVRALAAGEGPVR